MSEALDDNSRSCSGSLTFALFVASGVLTLEGRGWRWRAVTFTAAGVLFGVLTLVQPSVLVGVPLVALLGLGTRGARAARLGRAVKIDVVASDAGPGQRAERPGQLRAVPPGRGRHDLPRLRFAARPVTRRTAPGAGR